MRILAYWRYSLRSRLQNLLFLTAHFHFITAQITEIIKYATNYGIVGCSLKLVCIVAAARTSKSVTTCGMSFVTSFTDDDDDGAVTPVSVDLENACDVAAVAKSDPELPEARTTDESDEPVYVRFLLSSLS